MEIGKLLRSEETSGAFVPVCKDSLPSSDCTPKAPNSSQDELSASETCKTSRAYKPEVLPRANHTKRTTKKHKANQPAYKYRNVYKSVIRHLYVYTQDNKEKIQALLKEKGFGDEEIKTTLEIIKGYKSEDAPKEIEKGAKFRVEGMLRDKSIITYILKATLEYMIEKWKNERYGQLYKVNSTIYIEACTRFLKRTEELLNRY